MQLLTQRGGQRAKPQRVQLLDSNSDSVFRGAVGPWEFAQPPRASLSLSCKMEPLEESEREKKHWAPVFLEGVCKDVSTPQRDGV